MNKSTKMNTPIRTIAIHGLAITAFLAFWEYASAQGWLNPLFFGYPSAIYEFLVEGFLRSNKLWIELGYTLLGTFLAFASGSLAAMFTGFLFVTFPAFDRAAQPYLTFLNAIPRIALAPLFMLWFGIGLGSKVAVGFSLTFFIVLSATVAGIRGVSGDTVTLARSLGVSGPRIFFTITIPSAIPVIFAGLRLGLIYAMLGVVGAEIFASEHGLGQVLTFMQANFDTSGTLGLLFVLALLGLLVTSAMSWIERHLLKWQ
jgi:NitT/TauT family transport system permease protein